MLVDESYSFGWHSGRLLLDYGAGAELQSNGYNMLYWFTTRRDHETYWLRPFTCSSARTSLDEPYIKSGILTGMIPSELEPLLIYTENRRPGFMLQGIGALLVNLNDDKYAANFSLIGESSGKRSDELGWRLDLPELKHRLEFSFILPLARRADYTDSLDYIEGLRITFSRFNEPSATNEDDSSLIPVVQITLLKADYNFADDNLNVPYGYSCPETLSTPMRRPTNSSFKKRGSRMIYRLEVSDISGRLPLTSDGLAAGFAGSSQVPEPMDSFVEPRVSSNQLTLLYSELDKTIALVSRLRQPNGWTSSTRPALTVWDFNSRRMQVVQADTDTCDEPKGFRSSLFGGDGQNNKNNSSQCSISEDVEVQLSETLSIKLNENGLRFLTFSLQDRHNYGDLIEFKKLDDKEFEYEVSYERSALGLFCLYRTYPNTDSGSAKLIAANNIRLVTRFHYVNSLRLDLLTPKSSSLLLFDQSQSRLQQQIDINLLHHADYDPWSSSRHLLDFSPCRLGFKQSAHLYLEYPIDDDSFPSPSSLKQVESPRERIRSSLATHFRMTYSLPLTRLPSIEVHINRETVKIDVHILERPGLLSDSELLPSLSASVEQNDYMFWLRQATRSVLVNSARACSEYCQHYQCQVYVYCNYFSSCYIYSPNFQGFNTPGSATIKGSYHTYKLTCDAYEIVPARLDSANAWRKNSWSLDEILESVVNSVNVSPNSSDFANIAGNRTTDDLIENSMAKSYNKLNVMKPLIRIASFLKNSRMKQCRVFRLDPSFAHYQYDNLMQDAGALFGEPPNPFKFSLTNADNSGQGLPVKQMQIQDPRLTNFQVVRSGFRYLETNPVKYHHTAKHQHMDLENSGGYLTIEDYQLDDCARLCLADVNCKTFSYCSDTSQCIVTMLLAEDQELMMEMQVEGLVDGLQDSGSLTSKLTIGSDSQCAIMQRTYSDQFERFELKMLFHYSELPESAALTVFKASSADECATQCITQRFTHLFNSTKSESKAANQVDGPTLPITCLSFDYCSPISFGDNSSAPLTSSCVLFSQHLVSNSEHLDVVNGDHPEGHPPGSSNTNNATNLLQVLQRDIGMSMNSYCWHYARNFLADFHRINNRRLPDSMIALSLKNYVPPATSGDGEEQESSDQQGDDESLKSSAGEVDLESNGDQADQVISLAQCARLCEEDPDCGAFQFCIANYELAPSGLYLSCSLGTNETLELAPAHTGTSRPRQHHVDDSLQLVRSRVCSVYVYRSLALVLGHKKKNLARLTDELVQEAQESAEFALHKMMRLDLIILFAFFLFGFLVRDVGHLHQFAFQRLQESFVGGTLTDSIRRAPSSGSRGELSGSTQQQQPPPIPYVPTDQFKLESLGTHNNVFKLQDIATTTNESNAELI